MNTSDGKGVYVGMRVATTSAYGDALKRSVAAIAKTLPASALANLTSAPVVGVVTTLIQPDRCTVRPDNATLQPITVGAANLKDARSITEQIPWWAYVAGGVVAWKLLAGTFRIAAYGVAGYGAYRLYTEKSAAKK